MEDPQQQAGYSLRQFITAMSIGSVAAYFVTSFLTNFHPQEIEFILLAFFSILVCELIAAALISAVPSARRDWASIAMLLLASVLAISTLCLATTYPELFDRRVLFMETGRLPIFILMVLVTCLGVFIVSKRTGLISNLRSTRAFVFGREHLDGLFLALAFFLIYFTLAATINFPDFHTLDLYFDFDISTWLARLTETSVDAIPGIRPVHPIILLILRPPVWLISLLLNGDRLHALFVVHAITAASGVFMVWRTAKHITGSPALSLLTASMLGVSASHLLLGSMIETYIYSAFGLILFSFLIHSGQTSLRSIVPVGILITGITLSNIVQTLVLYASTRPSINAITKYVLLVALAVVSLNIVEHRIYPTARLLLAESSMDREFGFVHGIDPSSWRTIGRATLTVRSVLLYGVVAPTPFIHSDEPGWQGIPHFRTYKISPGEFHVAGYHGFGDFTVKFWLLLLMMAFARFAMTFRTAPSRVLIAPALLLCLAFNMVLHTSYGDDPMLYSPDWVYALVLFMAHAFKAWADKYWLQIALLIFVGFTAISNLTLIREIMRVSAPIFGQ